MNGLEERLAALEEEVRALREQVSGTVRAPLRVVNDEGSVILEVSTDEAGPRLRLFDGAGKTWIAMGGDHEGAVLGLYGQGETEGAVLFTEASGGRFVIFQETAETRIAMGTDADGGHLGIFDQSGRLVYARP